MSKWVDEDELTITYGTLRKAMAEAAEAERERIIALLEGVEWDAPEIAEPYVRHMVALIRGEYS